MIDLIVYFEHKQKGKKVTFVENWTAVHQHQDGQWINEAAEQRGVSFC